MVVPVHVPSLGTREADAVHKCVLDGFVSGNSPNIGAFEKEFGAVVNARHAVAVSSGTTALHLAFEALEIGKGDEVIVPSFTFAPCADMVCLTQAKVVFVDSDPCTFNVDPEKVRAAITPRTKAVLAVHMYGHPCDLAALKSICVANDLFLVEDCAQAIGARFQGQPVGSVGDVACYSFYANKTVTTGEGGMLTTNDESLAERTRWLIRHAIDSKDARPYYHNRLGFNYRMPALCAALGRIQVERFNEFMGVRAAHAHRYRERLIALKGLTQNESRSYCSTHGVWANHLLLDPAVLGMTRDDFAGKLAALQIYTRPFYYPLHLHGAYPESKALPHCEEFASRGLVLPSGNGLTLEQVDFVCDSIEKVCSNQ